VADFSQTPPLPIRDQSDNFRNTSSFQVINSISLAGTPFAEQYFEVNNNSCNRGKTTLFFKIRIGATLLFFANI
jgi:hypothetical protein